jgi:hypothetical protein
VVSSQLTAFSSISKPNANRPSRANDLSIRIYGLQMTDRVRHIHGDNRVTAQRDHHAETSRID